MNTQSNMRKFDLNIDTILENWNKSFAIRELIANALDEHELTKCKEDVKIEYSQNDGILEITDFGRGIKPEHFVQNESSEKNIDSVNIIGKFGIGLKDAIATLHRNNCEMIIISTFGKFTFKKAAKQDFNDIKTLHMFVDENIKINKGTTIKITNITAMDVEIAKKLFIKFRNMTPFSNTDYGTIYKKTGREHACIFVNGILVAKEENYKYHYNITKLTKTIRDAINRERNNVGKKVYSDRVCQMLLRCDNNSVMDELSKELENKSHIPTCEELTHADVLHAVIAYMSSSGKNVFMTKEQIETNFNLVDDIKKNGCNIILLDTKTQLSLEKTKDTNGKPITTLENYTKTYNDTFRCEFIDIDKLTPHEKSVYMQTDNILKYMSMKRIFEIKISEKIRDSANMNVVGLFRDKTVFIRRDMLSDVHSYAGILIHEYIHGMTSLVDVTRDFESELTKYIGIAIGNHIL